MRLKFVFAAYLLVGGCSEESKQNGSTEQPAEQAALYGEPQRRSLVGTIAVIGGAVRVERGVCLVQVYIKLFVPLADNKKELFLADAAASAKNGRCRGQLAPVLEGFRPGDNVQVTVVAMPGGTNGNDSWLIEEMTRLP